MYYTLSPDSQVKNQAFIADFTLDGKPFDQRVLTDAILFEEPGRLAAGIGYPGHVLDLNLADADVLICSEPAAQLIRDMCGDTVQLLPIDIAAERRPMFVANMVDPPDCIDRAKSVYGMWTEKDRRSDLVGQFRWFTKMVIDEARARQRALLRPKGWEVAIVCSDSFKSRVDAAGFRGVGFRPLEA